MNLQRITQVLIVIIPLLAYELATRLQLLGSFTFIPLSEMAASLGRNFADPAYLTGQLWPTASEILISFMGAAVLGVATGILLWRSNYLYHVTQPYLLLFYAVPFFAIYPIFVSIFGLGPLPVVTVGMLFAVPMVIINTAIGFRETREALVKVGQSFNLSFGQLLIHVFFPAAWPQIFTGLRLAAVYSIIGVIATEFILSSRGLGHIISNAYNNFAPDSMYASMLLVLILAVLVITVLSYFESKLRRQSSG